MQDTARKGDRYYAVIYEGADPITGRERRRWHPGTESRRRRTTPPNSHDADTMTATSGHRSPSPVPTQRTRSPAANAAAGTAPATKRCLRAADTLPPARPPSTAG